MQEWNFPKNFQTTIQPNAIQIIIWQNLDLAMNSAVNPGIIVLSGEGKVHGIYIELPGKSNFDLHQLTHKA